MTFTSVALPPSPRTPARHEEPRFVASAGALFLGTCRPFRDDVAHRSGMRSPEIRRLPPTSPVSHCPYPYGPRSWDSRRVPDKGKRQCREREPGQVGIASILAHPPGRLYGPPCVFLVRKFPFPLASTPLPANTVPEGSQRVGMGPRDQARWLPADCPTRRQSGEAIHPTGLRLVRQVSLHSRGPSVPSGPLDHRGRGSGLGWKGWQVRFRKAPCRW